MALVVQNLPANAGDVRDTGSIPGFRGIFQARILQWVAILFSRQSQTI